MEPVTPSPDREIVLALNSGSSSLKYGLYEVDEDEAHELATEAIETAAPDSDSFARIERAIGAAGLPAPTAIGHRIVHGGPRLTRHCLIDAEVIAQLEAALPFAPLHGPASLALLQLARAHFPALPQVACFDTAFHATLPNVASVLPLPRALREEGVRRYGFHGISCESILYQLRNDLPDRLVIAHLGNGASVTAVKSGRSIDTSMGLTPSGGIVMSTRSGDLDPGALLYLMREKSLDVASIATLIDLQSGLLGISGLSGDMRVLHDNADTLPEARLAIDIFCYSTRKQIGAMIAALGGIDLLVLTGGIGEHDAHVRSAISDAMGWAGSPEVRALPSQEDAQIARHVRSVLRAGSAPRGLIVAYHLPDREAFQELGAGEISDDEPD